MPQVRTLCRHYIAERRCMSIPDSEAKKAWDKEHTTQIAAKLNRNTDADIIAYLATCDSIGGTIKKALRLYMASVTSTDQEQ